jgi:hypothetical protein
MPLFEFINPSDPYFFEAPDLEIATVLVALMSEGKAAAQEVNGDLKVPLMLFGDPSQWFKENFGKTISEVLDHVHNERTEELIKALESFMIGSLEDRNLYFKTLELIDDPKKKTKFKKEYINQKQSSCNDFQSYAQGLARELRKVSTKRNISQPPAPVG